MKSLLVESSHTSAAESHSLKRTRRERNTTEELSLEEHINAKRSSLLQSREEVPVLREKVRDMRERASLMMSRHQKRRRMDILCAAEDLEKEIDVRASMEREHQFETMVVSFLKAFYNRDAGRSVKSGFRSKNGEMMEYARQSVATKEQRLTVMNEYLRRVEDSPPQVVMTLRDECPHCDGSRLLLCSVKSILSCPVCGYSVAYIDTTSTCTSYDDVVEYSQYSYKRVNHYMMWLTLVQGKEAHRVSDDILNSVMEDLYTRQRVRSPCDISQRQVRDTLRRLRLRKGYDHVAQITSRLTGVRPPRISSQTEELLKNMFLQMQPAFQKHSPRSRTNFLSYPYVLYRCFQILGMTHMLDGINLLKGRDKLEANDTIFRKMCVDLGWPVFDLPPTVDTVR